MHTHFLAYVLEIQLWWPLYTYTCPSCMLFGAAGPHGAIMAPYMHNSVDVVPLWHQNGTVRLKQINTCTCLWRNLRCYVTCVFSVKWSLLTFFGSFFFFRTTWNSLGMNCTRCKIYLIMCIPMSSVTYPVRQVTRGMIVSQAGSDGVWAGTYRNRSAAWSLVLQWIQQ